MVAQSQHAGASQLQFEDAASCVAWLESVPLTHAQQAQAIVGAQLELLSRSTIPAAERLRILETLHEPIAFVQGELAKKYIGRPVPLAVAELAVWSGVVEFWRTLYHAYRDCLRAAEAGDPEMAQYAPLACLRCLRCTGLAMREYFRVYRELDGVLWQQMHEAYAFAEARGFSALAVGPAAQGPGPATAAAAYAHALLAGLANPYALSARQMEIVYRWIDQWGGAVGVAMQPPAPGPAPALAVDLRSFAGVTFGRDIADSADARYLNLEQLGRTLRSLLAALRAGQSPAQLGLGQDSRQPGCEKLLTLLYIQWCGAGTGRIEERSQSPENAMVCVGIHAAHYHVSGMPFRQPGAPRTREEENDLYVFGHVTERTLRAQVSQRSAALETWQIVNRSASGFLGLVRNPDLGGRVGHQQLIAVAGAGGAFQVGVVQWMRQAHGGELSVGVRLFPGAPQAVAVRPAGTATAPAKYEKALLLPDAPAQRVPACLLLQPGTFQPARFLDLYTERAAVVKLTGLLERGADFERAEFLAPQ